MLFSVEQAFVGRDEIQAPLKTPALEASGMDECLRVLKGSIGRRFDSYSVKNSVLIISHITFWDCHLNIFSDETFLKIAVWGKSELVPPPEGNTTRLIWERERPSLSPTLAVFCLIFSDLCTQLSWSLEQDSLLLHFLLNPLEFIKTEKSNISSGN